LVAIFRLPHMRALFPDYLDTGSLRMADTISRENALPVIQTLKQAQLIFPDNDLVCASLGFTYARSGQVREAIPLFELASRQNPNEPQCWINLANIRMDNKEASKAREACETALRMAPTNVEALRLELKICSDLEDYQSALRCAKKLQALEPQDREHSNRVHEIEKMLETANPKPNLK